MCLTFNSTSVEAHVKWVMLLCTHNYGVTIALTPLTASWNPKGDYYFLSWLIQMRKYTVSQDIVPNVLIFHFTSFHFTSSKEFHFHRLENLLFCFKPGGACGHIVSAVPDRFWWLRMLYQRIWPGSNAVGFGR